MSQYITMTLLLNIILELLLIFLVVKLDHDRHRYTMALGDSSRWGLFLGRDRMVDVLFLVLYVAWMGYDLFKKIGSLSIGERLFAEGFFPIPIGDQLPLYGLFALYLSLGVFFVCPTFRSYIMSKLCLNPQRYIHRIAVWWMFSCFINLIYTKFFIPVTDYGDRMEDIPFLLLTKCQELLLAVLAVGGGSTRNGKETWIRLGMNRKPTGMGVLLSFSLKITLDFSLSIISQWVGTSGGGYIHPTLSWLNAIVITIMPAVGEELLFRGVLQPRVGIGATSVLFAAAHSSHDLFGIIGVFLDSLLYGWIARRYSIWLSIGLHMYNNAAASMNDIG
ncbi:CPBP family intramembrane glutamic endopeptidase [Pasteuria penetrans]|uniref:CPBP family intramembrane glutamic endopeptidase n=1 Tax=Pasteuria penetrans TaxID=86005 RepID=UPI001CAA6E06|nr:CPBP family intramembrane glutamic endopeptidase [Pasteuria penetrans]